MGRIQGEATPHPLDPNSLTVEPADDLSVHDDLPNDTDLKMKTCDARSHLSLLGNGGSCGSGTA